MGWDLGWRIVVSATKGQMLDPFDVDLTPNLLVPQS